MVDAVFETSDEQTIDRLASLREQTRLAGGRLAVDVTIGEWLNERLELLPRFGLEFDNRSKGLCLHINTDLARVLPEFLAATSFDPTPRIPSETSTPDPVLLRFSAFKSYRSAAQKSVIRAIATMPPGGTALVNMPTGGGKSLVFQILARLLRHESPSATLVVIVPTIALALDQERSLQGVSELERSRALHSGTPPTEQDEIISAFRRGEVPILLVAPETFIRRFEDLARSADPKDPAALYAPGQLNAVAVDEAHMIDQWGSQFRPDFQRLSGYIGRLRKINPSLRSVLLSATIDPTTRDLLTSQFRQEPWLEIDAGRPRYEFDFIARSFSDATERDEVLDRVVDHAPRPAIIYTTKVAEADALYKRLYHRGYRRLGLFNGDTSSEDRRSIIEQWSRDALDLIVATSAFGMGVDKANVRAVIHACLPESVSRFYQEIGRGGRDGRQALSMLLWTNGPDYNSDKKVARRVGPEKLLGVKLAKVRWKALLASAAEMGEDPETGRRILKVDLEAAHDGLDHGDTRKNRNWNAGLLTFLQRISLISVLSATDLNDRGRHLWTIRIDETHLLSPDADHADRIWSAYDAARIAELEGSQRALDSFVRLVERQRDCTLIGAFEAIEPEGGPFPPCGRCTYCRAKGIEPPTPPIRAVRLELWPDLAERTHDAQGLQIVLAKTDEVAERLQDIAISFSAKGFRHFVVDGTRGEKLASLLQACDEPSFVSTWDENLGFSMQMPTVFLAPAAPTSDRWWRCVDDARKRRPRWPYVLVMPGEQLLDGKGATAASILAPTSLDAVLAVAEDR